MVLKGAEHESTSCLSNLSLELLQRVWGFLFA